MHFEPYAVLISIFPIYSNQIFKGTKLVEFRKKTFSAHIKKIIVYSTHPIAKIEGYWDYDSVDSDSPTKIWKKYSKVGGIEKKKFDAYFANANIANAIKVKNPTRFKTPLAVSEINKKPPQSYVYLTEKEFNEILKKSAGNDNGCS